jgi:cytochrome c
MEIMMRRILVAMAAGAAAFCVQSVAYADGADEAKEHGCVKCHEVDKKKVGPSWKDISAKYKGKPMDEMIAAIKAKPVHKQAVAKAQDSSLKSIMEWVAKQ